MRNDECIAVLIMAMSLSLIFVVLMRTATLSIKYHETVLTDPTSLYPCRRYAYAKYGFPTFIR